MEKNIEIAKECGFTNAGVLSVDTMVVKKEVRDMCEMNTCQKYGKNWACPPACGELDECEKKLRKFSKGIIVQQTGQLEDFMDIEGLDELDKAYKASFKKAVERFSELYPNMLPLAAGPCLLCKECTYPDKDCRFPDKRVSSMESFGLVVNEVCKANDLPYNYGPNTMTYVGCFLFE